MKRILPILLILLLLTGCATDQPAESAPVAETVQTEPPVELVSLYDADSEVEKQTGGAVKAYLLGDNAGAELLTMGNKLLVVFADGILTALQGEMGQIVATGIADVAQDRSSGELTVWSNGVMYYDRQTREAVLLDTQLRESLRVGLPEESQGTPLLQSSGDIFYCTASEIRALNIYTGVSRLVRQHSYASQELTGSYLNDTVIGCRVTEESGEAMVLYLSADTGALVHTDRVGYDLRTDGNRYFATGGPETQYIFGHAEAEPMCLYATDEAVAGLPAAGGAVGYSLTEAGLKLNYYDLQSGSRTATVTIDGVGAPDSFATDGSYIWFTAENILYRWDILAVQIAEETVYTGQRYSADSPDLTGLAQCQDRAEQLYNDYGLTLYIWEEAAELAAEYTLQEEYRVSAINGALDQIESLLRTFPADFITTTGDVSFYLVGEMKDGAYYRQYWDGASCKVVLTCENTEKSFLQGLGVAIDTRVLGNSREFDTWDDLNPRGFRYTYDHEENLLRDDADDYLDAFIELEAMSFPTEDRCRIFAYAILPEGAEYFTHEDLQDKLLRMCEAIREAYDLEETPGILPWEQYLEEPIAPEE